MFNRIVILLLLIAPSIIWANEECVTQEQIDESLEAEGVADVKVELTNIRAADTKKGFILNYRTTFMGITEYHKQEISNEECSSATQLITSTTLNSMMESESEVKYRNIVECTAQQNNKGLKILHGAAAPIIGFTLGSLAILSPKVKGELANGIFLGSPFIYPIIPALIHLKSRRSRAKYLSATTLGNITSASLLLFGAVNQTSSPNITRRFIGVTLGLSAAPAIAGGGMNWALNSECKDQMGDE